MSYRIWQMSGHIADSRELDDYAVARIHALEIKSAEDKVEHLLVLTTAKYNCGAYREDMSCACGATHSNAMSGCWQFGHQREEEGELDEFHAAVMKVAYELLPREGEATIQGS